MICTLPQEDALLSRDGHLGSRPRQRVDGPGVTSQAWGALAMGYEGSGLVVREDLQTQISKGPVNNEYVSRCQGDRGTVVTGRFV